VAITTRQEAQWVLRAQCNDREALELLLRSIQPALHRYVRGLVGSPDADDVLQDVLVIVCRKLIWLHDPELFRPWVFRIATRAGVRHLKQRARWRERSADDSTLETLAAPEERPSDELMRQLLTSDVLSPGSRAVLLLHFQEELTLPEVAAILEIPLGTVKSRLAFGLSALRRHMRKTGGPDA
jgi:RNA polymerase sigma-70 factor (ECF subfamily)